MAALERNQRWWLLRVGVASGETVRRLGGIIWFDAPAGTSSLYVPFPSFTEAGIGEELDTVVAAFRSKAVRRPVWLWAQEPPVPTDLPLRLMARGFRHGFEPHWMWLDLVKLRSDFSLRHEIRLEFDPDPAQWDPETHVDYIAPGRLARCLPDRVKQIVARDGERPIGAACVFLTRGANGIAGIYDVGVLPEYRNLGIGKALTHAACAWARDRGYRIAGLNATPMGEPVYRALGFVTLRHGQTWQLPIDVQSEPLTSGLVRFAEAIGGGAIDALERATPGSSAELDLPLPCRHTPLQLAALFKQPASAEWLIAHGATLDLLSCWELGWIDRAHAMLSTHPELANVRSGEWAQTPLHVAASRGDLALIQLLSDAGADLEARDGTFHGRPLEWAQHFGQIEAANLLLGLMNS
jgi:GNAT superfamily N-acetyltransferase